MSVFDHWELILRQVIVANSLYLWVHGSWSALIMAILSWLVFVSLWKRNHHRTKCNLILLEPQIATDHCQGVIIIFIKIVILMFPWLFYILYFYHFIFCILFYLYSYLGENLFASANSLVSVEMVVTVKLWII